jgi:hypothetical protein
VHPRPGEIPVMTFPSSMGAREATADLCSLPLNALFVFTVVGPAFVT